MTLPTWVFLIHALSRDLTAAGELTNVRISGKMEVEWEQKR